jgi:hypothetical protein
LSAAPRGAFVLRMAPWYRRRPCVALRAARTAADGIVAAVRRLQCRLRRPCEAPGVCHGLPQKAEHSATTRND